MDAPEVKMSFLTLEDTILVILRVVESEEAVEIILCHDRVSARDVIRQRLEPSQIKLVGEVLNGVGEGSDVAERDWERSPFVLPETVLGEFDRLLSAGAAVYTRLNGSLEDVVLEALDGEGLSYCWVSTPTPDPDTAVLSLFMDPSSNTVSVNVASNQSGVFSLARAQEEYKNAKHIQLLREAGANDMLPTTEPPQVYRLNDTIGRLLVLGYVANERTSFAPPPPDTALD